MTVNYVLSRLEQGEAVLTNSHFVFTSDKHGSAYVNVRAVAHDSDLMNHFGLQLASCIFEYSPDIIVGPETLGRTLATLVGDQLHRHGVKTVWCDMIETDGVKRASFSPKLDFGRLIKPGVRVAIVDDLLTTGSSIRLVAELVREHGGEVIVAAVVARRSPDVNADTCNVPVLKVLAEVKDFKVFTEDECKEYGPCSKRVPMVLRPGHGHKWIKNNPDYPVANP